MSPDAGEHVDARERLLVAAQALYAEGGVAATTPRQVLERSGVGQGSLYHHFPTKKDLARATVERTVQEQLDASARALTGDDAPLERVVAYLTRDRDAVAGCRVGRLTADPIVMADAELSSLVAGYFADLLHLVTDALEEAGLSPGSARDRASAIVAVVQGGYVLARAAGDPELMRSAVRGVIALLEGATHVP
jgi:AcrR family transcriptional regulator